MAPKKKSTKKTTKKSTPAIKAKRFLKEVKANEEMEYGTKELIHGILIGLIIGFIIGIILFRGNL